MVDEDKAASHVAPHDQFAAVDGGELGIQLEEERVVKLDVTARFFL